MLMAWLLVGSVACDVVGQVSFKLGVSGGDASGRSRATSFFRSIAGSPWIGFGVAVYALEFLLWFAALSLAPLSFAVAFAALSYCGVVLASRIVLRERVSLRQWRGTSVIAAGVAFACWPQLS